MPEYKSIGEVSDQLNIPAHVLRFWETKFRQLKPAKRRGNRRFYSESDIALIENIRIMLHVKGYTIKGAQKELNAKNQGFLKKALTSKELGSVEKKRLEKVLLGLRKIENTLKSA